ncbi:hypothetical protein ACFSHQ_18165 [Gemmobacter lanyuensis]
MADQIRFLRDVRDHRMTIELDQESTDPSSSVALAQTPITSA